MPESPLIIENLSREIEQTEAKFLDVRIASDDRTLLIIQNGKLRKPKSIHLEGIAALALVGESWGFSQKGMVSSKSLEDVIKRSVRLAKMNAKIIQSETTKIFLDKLKIVKNEVRSNGKIDPSEISLEDKVKDLSNLESTVRKYDNRICDTLFAYRESLIKEHIYNNLGTEVLNEITYTYVRGNSYTEDRGLRSRVSECLGGRGYELIKRNDLNEIYLSTAEKSVKLLGSSPIPEENYTVIMDPKLSGVIIHELLGHGLEADIALLPETPFHGKLGQAIGQASLNVIDDPLNQEYYTYNMYDSEGTRCEKTYIIHKGKIVNLLHSIVTAFRTRVEPNGHGRAMSHFKSLPRVSNTYIEAGDLNMDELIEGINMGIYIKGWSGYKEIDIKKGTFYLSSEEGYIVKNGKIENPLRGLSISGNILDFFGNIDGIGDNLQLAFIGHCRKGGQLIPVSAGGPHIRVKKVRIHKTLPIVQKSQIEKIV